jgi:hypothetical protein
MGNALQTYQTLPIKVSHVLVTLARGKMESHFVTLLYMSYEVGVQILMRVHALDARWLGGKGGI